MNYFSFVVGFSCRFWANLDFQLFFSYQTWSCISLYRHVCRVCGVCHLNSKIKYIVFQFVNQLRLKQYFFALNQNDLHLHYLYNGYIQESNLKESSHPQNVNLITDFTLWSKISIHITLTQCFPLMYT